MIIDAVKFALVLKDQFDKKPRISITVNNSFQDTKENPFVVMDVQITNMTDSAFSISAIKLNDTEMILSPLIATDHSGGRSFLRHEDEFGSYIGRYIPDGNNIPFINPIPDTPYFNPKESIRGLAIWEIDVVSIKDDWTLSTIILSENRFVSASIKDKIVIDHTSEPKN